MCFFSDNAMVSFRASRDLLLLLLGNTLAWDGCGFLTSWRCGDVCIEDTECNCGGTIFNHTAQMWCCQDSPCTGKGELHDDSWFGEEDKVKIDEMNKIEAFLAQAKTDAVLPNDEEVEQQPHTTVANWSGLTEQDIELYNENWDWESSPFYCSTCNTDCQNQGALDMHLEGKPHAKKVKSKKL